MSDPQAALEHVEAARTLLIACVDSGTFLKSNPCYGLALRESLRATAAAAEEIQYLQRLERLAHFERLAAESDRKLRAAS